MSAGGEIVIDGRALPLRPGQTILEVCDEHGVRVPRLCYLKGLSPAGACRMCIVEIEGQRKVAPSCATPAVPGMVVRTQTPQLAQMRRITLELLFSERNHFCPFCEVSGGDCELQNLGYELGMERIRYDYLFPRLETDLSHPFIALDHNRCILCARCVRACDELEGTHTLDLEGRGHRTLVTADLGGELGSSSCTACGACVVVCPTGALFEKQGAYRGRSADCDHVRSRCRVCSVGCELDLWVRHDQLIRVVGHPEGRVNAGHACVRARFHLLEPREPRLLVPLVRDASGSLVAATWGDALARAAALLDQAGARAGAVAAASLGNAAQALFRELFARRLALPAAQIAVPGVAVAALVEEAAAAQASAAAPVDLTAVLDRDLILVIGCDPAANYPVFGSMIRRQVNHQTARLFSVNRFRTGLDFWAEARLRPRPGREAAWLAALWQEMGWGAPPPALAGLAGDRAPAPVAEEERAFVAALAAALRQAARPAWVYGRGVTSQRDPQLVAALHEMGARLGAGTPVLRLVRGGNAAGAAQAWGDAPRAARLALPEDCAQMAGRSVDLLYLAAGAEACLGEGPAAVTTWLESVPRMIVQASHRVPLVERASVVLPAADWAEESGQITAVDGSAAAFAQAVALSGGARPNAWILAALRAALDGRALEEWLVGAPLDAASRAQLQLEVDALRAAREGAQ